MSFNYRGFSKKNFDRMISLDEAKGRGGQGFLWDDPEFQWEDVPFQRKDIPSIIEMMEDQFKKDAQSAVAMYEDEDYLINYYGSGISPTDSEYYYDMYSIKSDRFETFIEQNDLSAEQIERLVNDAIQNRVDVEIEREEAYMLPTEPDMAGVTILVMQIGEMEEQIDLELNEKYNYRGVKFTLLDFIRVIDWETWYNLLEDSYGYEAYSTHDSKRNEKQFYDIKEGKQKYAFTFEIYINVSGGIRWVIPEKDLMRFAEKWIIKNKR